MRAWPLVLAVMTAAACTPLDSVPIAPAPFAQKDCTAKAMAAVKDAAADDYDAGMQDVVYKNSYNQCVRAKARAKPGK